MKRILLPALVIGTLLLGACGGGGGGEGEGETTLPAEEPSAPEPQDFLDQLQGSIIFVSISEEGYEYPYSVNIVNANGTGLRRLLEITVGALTLDKLLVTPSPDGSKIAFIHEDYLRVINIADGEIESLIQLQEESGSAHDRYIAWSPTSTQIAYVANEDLYLINANGSDNQNLVQSREGKYSSLGSGFGTGTVGDQIRNPTWSADGKRILFDDFSVPSSVTLGELKYAKNRNVYEYDLDSGTTKILVSESSVVGSTPDLTKVVVCTWQWQEGECQRFVMNDDGSNYTGPVIYLASYYCSPDGSLVAYITDGGIAVLDATTGITEEMPIIPTMYPFSSLAWSPDSQYIAYSYSSEYSPDAWPFSPFDALHEIRVIKCDSLQSTSIYSAAEQGLIEVLAWIK